MSEVAWLCPCTSEMSAESREFLTMQRVSCALGPEGVKGAGASAVLCFRQCNCFDDLEAALGKREQYLWRALRIPRDVPTLVGRPFGRWDHAITISARQKAIGRASRRRPGEDSAGSALDMVVARAGAVGAHHHDDQLRPPALTEVTML